MIKLFQWHKTDHLAFPFVPLELKGKSATWLLLRWDATEHIRDCDSPSLDRRQSPRRLAWTWSRIFFRRDGTTGLCRCPAWHTSNRRVDMNVLKNRSLIVILNTLRIITHYVMDRCSSQAVRVQKAVVQNNDTLFMISGYNNDLSGLF